MDTNITPKSYLHNIYLNAPTSLPVPDGSQFYDASQIRRAYNIPDPNLSVNVTVAVLTVSGSIYGTIDPVTGVVTNGDVQAYWTAIGIPPAQHPKVIVKFFGTASRLELNDAGTTEATMDISAIGGICPSPNLTIILYVYKGLDAFKEFYSTGVYTPVVVGSTSYTPTIVNISMGVNDEDLWFNAHPSN